MTGSLGIEAPKFQRSSTSVLIYSNMTVAISPVARNNTGPFSKALSLQTGPAGVRATTNWGEHDADIANRRLSAYQNALEMGHTIEA